MEMTFSLPFMSQTRMELSCITSFPTVNDDTGNSLVFTEMAWYKGRGMLWAATDACRDHPVQVYLLDPTTGEATFQFEARNENDFSTNFADGLTYDGTDHTVWMSPDGPSSTDIYHYEENGTLINVITPKDSNGAALQVSGVISGVIVGVGDFLFVGKRRSGEIFKVKKSDGSFISSFPPFGVPGTVHNEGLKCDVKSFAPKTVILTTNAKERQSK
jgi:hypothetical protein